MVNHLIVPVNKFCIQALHQIKRYLTEMEQLALSNLESYPQNIYTLVLSTENPISN